MSARRSILALVIAGALAITARASAQLPEAFEAPWTDVAPAVEGDHVVVAGLGMPDERLGRLAARRDAARRAGEERARRALHQWVDDALARVGTSASVAADAHRAIDEHASVARVRALSDGGAVVEVRVPLEALRAAVSRGGLPWSR